LHTISLGKDFLETYQSTLEDGHLGQKKTKGAKQEAHGKRINNDLEAIPS
jgi:hypothetical protein